MITRTSTTGMTRPAAVATPMRAGAPRVAVAALGVAARETVTTRVGLLGSSLLPRSGAVAMDAGATNTPTSDPQPCSSVPPRRDL